MSCNAQSAAADTFATRLGAAMAARGMTQRALAAAAGLSESAVSQYLSGAREPSLRVLANLCSALGTTPSDLVPVAASDSIDVTDPSDKPPVPHDTAGVMAATMQDAASLIMRNASLLSAAERKNLVLALFDA